MKIILNKKEHLFDVSLWIIILGNLISIVMAIHQNWDINHILWVYWSQSVIIGAVNVYRILSLKEFTTDGMTQNGKAVPETKSAKTGIAVFFAIHYGFFHFVYSIFLWQEMPLSEIPAYELSLLLLVIFGFFSSHGFSYKYNVGKDFKHKKPNLGTIMFYPYLRIIPMHLIIIFGATIGSTSALIIFMLLKTFADAGMHIVEHHLFRKKT